MTRIKNRMRGLLRPVSHFLIVLLMIFAATLSGCVKQPQLTDYVSEYRNNLFLYDGESFFVKAQNSRKEYPYVADGYVSEMTCRAEFFITPPPDVQSCQIFFTVDGIQHGGEASFDRTKRQFYYSCAANVAEVETLPVRLQFDDTETEITLTSVKSPDLLSLKALLSKLFAAEGERLKKLTRNGAFEGELYVRILYEDAPYFYVGVVDRQGEITAYLLGGKTGEILAKRTD